ncbi:MAG: GYD domain-containing protein, partial [Candidatus Binatia bacterium]
MSRQQAGFLVWRSRKETGMATFVSLVNFTEEGARHIRQTAERAKGLVNAAANLGIKIKDIYWTMG